MTTTAIPPKIQSLENADAITTPEENPWAVVFRRFIKHRLAVISSIFIFILFLTSFFAKQIAPFEPQALNPANRFLSPGTVNPETGKTHWLGTDNLGRDYFSRMLYSGRVSLSIAFITVFISLIIGIVIGVISGYYQGWLDGVLMRIVDLLGTLPGIPILLILSSILLSNKDAIPIPNIMLRVAGAVMLLDEDGARQGVMIALVLAALGWLGMARLIRGLVLSLKTQTFVEAAKALGATDGYIMFRHLVPNTVAVIIVTASLELAGVLIGESALSFLGFGLQEPVVTWGNMLANAQDFMLDRPYLAIICGLPILLCALAFNFIGDGLRDALDPRLKL
ncbi:MAG TPA: ABC transporter permease [Anaerolineales bacterium]|nr:ABC transporter permease [Anaerolineales bacterium]